MGKKRNNTENILLPEVVVTPHGNYTKFTGEENVLPTLDYFRQAEIDKDRVNAVSRMLALNAPVDPRNPSMSYPSVGLGLLGMSDETRNYIFGNDDKRRTCLYTVSSQYNDTPVASNPAFTATPEQYGFKEVSSPSTGDIVQFWKHGTTPSHATMMTGYSPEGIPLITYSNGNVPAYNEWHGPNGEYETKDNLIRNREITDKPIQDLGTEHYYRYIGSPKKQGQIERRYQMLQNGERIYKDGGFLQPRDAWNELSLPEQAAMMKVAVKNGIYNLRDIRQKYNEFAEGGSTDDAYYSQMEKVAEENYKDWGFANPEEALVQALNDNTYNYRDFYREYPWSEANATTHWPDAYKTVYHPTFSNESIYSGNKSQYNPRGLYGGHWVGGTFVPAPWQRGPLVEAAMNEYKSGGDIHIKPSKKGTFTAAASRHGMEVQEFASKVLAHPENYSPAMRKKANFARNAKKFKHSFGGPLVENLFYPQDGNLYGFGDWLKKGWNWLKNSAQVAVIAENPAVMIAAGHRVTREGKAMQDKYNDPSVRQLRSNLASLGEGALGAITATGDAEAIYNAVRHPVQTARGLKSAINSGMKAVKNLSPLEKHNIKNYSSTSHFVPELDAQYIGQSLFDAKAYKTSDGYKDLVKRAIKESEEMGTGFFPEETFILPNDKVPHITFSKRPKGDLAGYKPSTNTIDIDLVQSRGKEVPFHEGLHWQKVGEENLNIGPKHDAWWKSVQDKEPTEIQDQLFYEFFNSSEFPKAQYRRNANEYLLTKTKQAVKEDTPINSEIRKPYELNAHSIEAGRAIGIEPFSPYPGYKEASKKIKKAIKYDKSLEHVKHDNRAEVENFWNLLTGNYMPVVLGGVTLTPQLTEE